MFQGLGDLGEECYIQLKQEADPNSLYAPRTVPIPLHSKVLDELNQMEKLGFIIKVSESTEWCA